MKMVSPNFKEIFTAHLAGLLLLRAEIKNKHSHPWKKNSWKIWLPFFEAQKMKLKMLDRSQNPIDQTSTTGKKSEIYDESAYFRKFELTSHSWSFLQGLCFSASKYFGSPHQPFVQRKEPDFQPVHFVFGCFFYQTYWWFPHTYRVVYLIGSPLFQYWKGKRVEASHSYHSTKSSIKEQSAVLLIAAHHVWST